MHLYWLMLSAESCSFNEISRRQCIAIGWPELGSLEKYVRDRPDWERRFKSYLQIRGDVAYTNSRQWQASERDFDQVPSIFWRMLQIKKGDLVLAVESGNELTLGRPTIRGVCRASADAINSYAYDDAYHHAHRVCPDTKWVAWDRLSMGEPSFPKQNFRTLCQDDSQIDTVMAGWEKGSIS